jgi:hypothetical protein
MGWLLYLHSPGLQWKDGHHQNSMHALVLTACYVSLELHYFCYLLPQCLHQTHFHTANETTSSEAVLQISSIWIYIIFFKMSTMTGRKLYCVERNAVFIVSTNIRKIWISDFLSNPLQVHSPPHPLTAWKLQKLSMVTFKCMTCVSFCIQNV